MGTWPKAAGESVKTRARQRDKMRHIIDFIAHSEAVMRMSITSLNQNTTGTLFSISSRNGRMGCGVSPFDGQSIDFWSLNSSKLCLEVILIRVEQGCFDSLREAFKLRVRCWLEERYDGRMKRVGLDKVAV